MPPEGLTASVLPDPDLHGNLVRVPGDISSAAYFIAAALIVPGSEVLLKNVGINPTRDGMLRVCRAMGADITLLMMQNSGGEPVADLLVRYTPSLSGTVIEGELIPTLIDENPDHRGSCRHSERYNRDPECGGAESQRIEPS